jgi:hypothetical protein
MCSISCGDSNTLDVPSPLLNQWELWGWCSGYRPTNFCLNPSTNLLNEKQELQYSSDTSYLKIYRTVI